MDELDSKKYHLELKQNVGGTWYVGSLKINANDLQELDQLISSAVPFLSAKVDKLNLKEVEAARPPEVILNDEERALFEKLRQMRMDLARAENIPPYIIMHDSTLRHIAKAKPMNSEELLKVEGMGEKKVEKYGVYLLKVIQNHKEKEINNSL